VAAALAAPGSSQAFMTTDDVVWPNSGSFPAYPAPEGDGRAVHAWVSGGYYHDDNLFRLSNSVDPTTILGKSDKSDDVYRAGLGLKADFTEARQHFIIDAQLDGYKYTNYSNLDNNSYLLGANWLWAAGNDWTGTAGASVRHFLGGWGELQAPTRDMVTETHPFVSAAYSLTARYKLRGLVEEYDYRHAPGAALLDNNAPSATVGVDYITPGLNSVGLQVKYTDATYPNSQLVGATLINNNYTETETSAVAHWLISGKSTIDARLGYTSRVFNQFGQRDFHGPTGNLNFLLEVGSKTTLLTEIYRELVAYEALPGSFAPTYSDFTATYVITNGLSIGPRWAPTATISLGGQYLYEKRDFKGDPTAIITGERKDTYSGLQLSAGYQPLTRLQLSLAFERGVRSSNLPLRDFTFNAIYANARYTFY
jgi:exopolysaccharide biosynthesis operon protein EpsL